MNKAICNIPEDLLRHQVSIDIIPDVTLLMILILVTTFVVLYWRKWKQTTDLSEFNQMLVIIGLLVVFCPLWYGASKLLVNILTNVLNPEYAAIVKFYNKCGG